MLNRGLSADSNALRVVQNICGALQWSPEWLTVGLQRILCQRPTRRHCGQSLAALAEHSQCFRNHRFETNRTPRLSTYKQLKSRGFLTDRPKASKSEPHFNRF